MRWRGLERALSTVAGGLPPRLRRAVAAGEPLLFLSAHLDDAVFSCGALIAALRPSCPTTVATIFTEATRGPHTYAARSFLRQCSAPDVATLYAERRAEDLRVLTGLGVAHRHLGMADALFRHRSTPAALAGVGRLLPELVHRYPTYRFDIARGRVSGGDRGLVAELVERIGGQDAGVVFAPVGIGSHVDHLLTRAVGEHFGERCVYYSDFPYNLSAAPDPGFVSRHGLTTWDWGSGIAEKDHAIRGYHTQYDAIFGAEGVTHRPETYFVTAS